MNFRNMVSNGSSSGEEFVADVAEVSSIGMLSFVLGRMLRGFEGLVKVVRFTPLGLLVGRTPLLPKR